MFFFIMISIYYKFILIFNRNEWIIENVFITFWCINNNDHLSSFELLKTLQFMKQNVSLLKTVELIFKLNLLFTETDLQPNATNNLIWNPFYCVIQQEEQTFTAYCSEELSVNYCYLDLWIDYSNFPKNINNPPQKQLLFSPSCKHFLTISKLTLD